MRSLTLLLAFLTICSCKEEANESKYLSCDSFGVYQGNSDLNQWETKIVENDTAIVQVYFDTLLFDSKNIINTISYTWFQDSVNSSFDWDAYIEQEVSIIQSDFTLIKRGTYTEQLLQHWWFLVEKEGLTSYIEYIKSNPLTTVIYSSSETINMLNDEFCILKKVSKQAKILRP